MSEPHPGPSAAELIAAVDPGAARDAITGVTVRSPTIASDDLAARAGGPVSLKAECLQRTGSFKLRGALNKVATLGERADAGLVTASAGNHGRAVAQAARVMGVVCEVFMPSDAPVSKVAAVERLGAKVHQAGATVEEALELAAECAERLGRAFVHPFDDIDVIAGQGTVGLELLEDVPDLARVIVPVGGGGLASGVGAALVRADARVELVGVQARACAPFALALESRDSPAELEPSPGATIADGIAIKRPGLLTLPLLRELLARLETVTEDEIAGAMVFLAENAKLVAEGAGAVSVAALLSGRLPPVDGTTVAIVSGGNVDGGLLAGLLRRHETEEGRRVRMFTRVADRPGGLAELLNLVAGARANLVSLEHVREAVPLRVRETGVELTLETRGPAHTDEVLTALAQAGYEVTLE
ncbi:MAG: threonine dehydratase [Solirubrobacterales bacterium]|nr:threonine dehydratase [Solirubrobacterales bacterium]MCW3026038.1 threonine dehydratase [Solirubrobacterales bacterium]